MTWQLTRNVAEFRRAANAFLAADPVLCTLLLGVSETVRVAGPSAYDPGGGAAARFGWWRAGDAEPVTGLFLQTPPFVPLLGPMPERAVTELPSALRREPSVRVRVRGARGPADVVSAFAEACGHADDARTGQRLRLFRLADPAPRAPSPAGRVRAAVREDLPLLTGWFAAFGAVAPSGATTAAEIGRRIDEGRLLLWEADGVPVSIPGSATDPWRTSCPSRGDGRRAADQGGRLTRWAAERGGPRATGGRLTGRYARGAGEGRCGVATGCAQAGSRWDTRPCAHSGVRGKLVKTAR